MIVHRVADESGQTVAWLVKMLASVAVAAVLLIDFGAVVINRIQAADLASEAAIQAGFAYRSGGNLERAEEAAVDHVRGAAEILGVSVDQDQSEITVKLRKIAATKVFVHRWSVTEGLTEATVDGTAPLAQPGGRF